MKLRLKMSRKCQQCKQTLEIIHYIGEQKRCKSCAESRLKKDRRKCESKSCNKQPSFGLESENKKDGVLNINIRKLSIYRMKNANMRDVVKDLHTD